MARRTVVAMSGGVDSSVAAALLARDPEAGEVLGVTMKLMPKLESSFGCCGSPRELDDARRVCEKLGIAHYVLDLSEDFEREVVSPFVADYLAARTPNPCVECNRKVKFDRLLKLADAWGADRLATGHYARVDRSGPYPRLLRSEDPAKDQSYFLYPMPVEALDRVDFPIGGLGKPQVRRIARELGLVTADKPESQEICFVPSGDYRRFLEARVPEAGTLAPGPVVDPEGRPLGTHAGVARYTPGQRKGLPAHGTPLFVLEARPETNTLVAASSADAQRSDCVVGGMNWLVPPPSEPREVLVQLRHRQTPFPATMIPDFVPSPFRGEGPRSGGEGPASLPSPFRGEGPRSGGEGPFVRLSFKLPQRGVAPGQSAVLFEGDTVLGGGRIEREP